MNKEKDQTSDANMNGATKLAKYLFFTEQMGWHKGLKIFREEGEEAVEKELQNNQ